MYAAETTEKNINRQLMCFSVVSDSPAWRNVF